MALTVMYVLFVLRSESVKMNNDENEKKKKYKMRLFKLREIKIIKKLFLI